ncbi:MAG TPA: hypothetical protein VF021_07665 [Longimicrobiales bacterium]
MFATAGPLAAQDSAACRTRLVSYVQRAHVTPEYFLDASSANGGRLSYFGAVHSTDVSDAQFKRLQEAWQKLRPTVAFYEGPRRSEAATFEETVREFGESGAVRFLAARDGARIERLEPDPVAETKAMMQLFPADQVKLFYVMRETARLRDRRGLHGAELEDAIDRLLQQAHALFADAWGEPWGIAELAAAYHKYWSTPASWLDAPSDWFDPMKTSAQTGGVFTNEINTASSEFRDRHMYDVLLREVLKGERVFAVVGRDHLPAQIAALRCALAQPVPASAVH